jgi:hypothetical protein
MSEKEKRFEVLSVGEMRKKYYRPDEQPPQIRLNPQHVPEALRVLIPLAEKWGISDDILRLDAVDRAPPAEVADLKKIIAQYDDLFDEWLAGPEARNPKPSAEYLAFSNMRMAADGC